MQAVVRRLASLSRIGCRLGPYLMLEILMPGGTLVAVLLFFYRRRSPGIGSWAPRAAETVKRVIDATVGLGRMGQVSLRGAPLRSEP